MTFLEAKTYNFLAFAAFNKGSKENVQLAVEYFEKCRDLLKALGHISSAESVEGYITIARAQCEGCINPLDELEQQRRIYNYVKSKEREEDSNALGAARELIHALLKAYHTIEAERLTTKLAAKAVQVHGNEHTTTKSTVTVLRKCKVRKVWIVIGGVSKVFEALRYEDDGETSVVQGPIEDPRNAKKEETFTVATADLDPDYGTPVICHGLEGNLSQFNGIIGDLRPGSEKSGIDVVYFEDKNLGHCSVQPANVRVLFDLPDVE